ncbi:MAG: hypothetical protein CVU97_00175 [Firmicutes bacterium HGW-Firmicutes-21]|nr:MAG: hypothetical protein CVU97_00175 [Firmicutes bacterium HGW-Firmicutes-21]
MKRKYPFSIFIFGVFLNVFKLWYLVIPTIVLFILSFINLWFAIIGVATTVLILVIVIAQQIQIKKVIIAQSDNEQFNDFLNKSFIDNGLGYKNIIDQVDRIIESQSEVKKDDVIDTSNKQVK